MESFFLFMKTLWWLDKSYYCMYSVFLFYQFFYDIRFAYKYFNITFVVHLYVSAKVCKCQIVLYSFFPFPKKCVFSGTPLTLNQLSFNKKMLDLSNICVVVPQGLEPWTHWLRGAIKTCFLVSFWVIKH